VARSGAGTALFALFLFFGGALSLFAAIYLPAWLEVRALRRERAAAEQQIAMLQQQLTRVSKQIEHLQTDPAYIERLAYKEFRIEPPGLEWIPAPDELPEATDAAGDGIEAGGVEHWAARFEQAAHSNPLLAVFMLPRTRPMVIIISGAAIAVAIVLLVESRTDARTRWGGRPGRA